MDLIGFRSRTRLLSMVLAAALSLTACGDDDGDETAVAARTPQTPSTPQAPPTSGTPPSAGTPPSGGGASNRAPTLSGTPLASTLFGRQYSFAPTASDADGNALAFSIQGRPAWATFDSATGLLRGTPTQADVGTFSNIRISVSDGTATTALAAFNVQVVATASGSATLSWTPPVQNSDGAPLNDLAAYRIYFGTAAGTYPNSTAVGNPGLASFVVDQLTPATWYFVVTAVNSNGVESSYSNVATKTVM
jgi:hypothetical protein